MSDENTQAVETTTDDTASIEAEAPAAVEKPLSAGDALRAAAKKLEPAPKPAPKVAEKAPAKPAEPIKPGAQPRDPTGRFAAIQQAAEKPGEASSEQAEAATDPKVEAEKPPEAEKPAASFRAPQSWSPSAREALAKASPEVQQEVLKRERDFAVGIQQHAERAKYADRVQQAIGPVAQHWQAKGIDPLQAIQGLARVDYMLNTGSPQERARLIGHLVRTTLGTDEAAIQLLGQAIDGGGAAQAPGPQQLDPEALLQQAEQRVMKRLEAGRMQAAQTRAQQSIAKLAELEFFGDVQQDMADILELATRRGQTMTPEDAYHRAVALNPELSKIVQQREAAKSAAGSQEAQKRAQAASSSLRSQPGTGPGPAGKALSPAQALRQAAADLSGRGRV